MSEYGARAGAVSCPQGGGLGTQEMHHPCCKPSFSSGQRPIRSPATISAAQAKESSWAKISTRKCPSPQQNGIWCFAIPHLRGMEKERCCGKRWCLPSTRQGETHLQHRE